MARIWSPQQQAFFDWAKNGSGSAVVEAVAGSGKTSSMIESLKYFDSNKNIAMLAYNKAIGDELAFKCKEHTNVLAGTVHSFGLRAFSASFQRPKIESQKVSNLTAHMFGDHDVLKIYLGIISKLVGFAKQRALGIIGEISNTALWYDIANHFDVFSELSDQKVVPADAIIAAAQMVLNESNKVVDIIDFDDMVYLPVLLGAKFNKFDVVMVDEAQDTNPARRALVRCLLAKGGRVVAVGDPHQAIYGFTGADNDSLKQISDDFGCETMRLSVTYRCPKAIVGFAKTWVNHIEAADTAKQGSYLTMTTAEMLTNNRQMLDKNSVILCRLTAPIIGLAFELLSKGIACKVEGRDIGAGLKKLAQKWKIRTTDKLLEKLSAYKDNEVTKALAKKLETKAQQIEDQVNTLVVIIENVNARQLHTVDAVIAEIDRMFSDNVNGVLTLSTIHKSKGREWNNVFWLNRTTTCPSKYARQPWQIAQEKNLCYVAATRAMDKLIDLS